MLDTLELIQFRNYPKQLFRFSSDITVIVGPNASGKTSILEAVYLLATATSFRAGKDQEMIQSDQEVARVKGKIDTDLLEVVLTPGLVKGQRTARKRLLVNAAGKRKKDFVDNLPVVLFEPQDLLIVLGSPSKRRDYLDRVLCQVDWKYAQSLSQYTKGMRQRNKLLKLIREGHAHKDQLGYWDELVLTHGNIIQTIRKSYIDVTNSKINLKDSKIPKPQPGPQSFIFNHQVSGINFRLDYQPNQMSQERLQNHWQAQVATGNTLVGPHRDDFAVFFQTKGTAQAEDLALYGSRGQQRLGVLYLKLSELAYLEQQLDTKPLLLLDDIFSELDEDNRELVLSVMGQYQTIITTTDIQFIKEHRLRGNVIELS